MWQPHVTHILIDNRDCTVVQHLKKNVKKGFLELLISPFVNIVPFYGCFAKRKSNLIYLTRHVPEKKISRESQSESRHGD